MSIGLAGCVNALFAAKWILEGFRLAGSIILCALIFIGFELLPDDIDDIDDITFGADVFRHGTAGLMKRSLVLRPCNRSQIEIINNKL